MWPETQNIQSSSPERCPVTGTVKNHSFFWQAAFIFWLMNNFKKEKEIPVWNDCYNLYSYYDNRN